jgi:hypothetical protein
MRILLAIVCLTIIASPAQAQRRQTSLLNRTSVEQVTQLHLTTAEPLAHYMLPDCDSDRTRGRADADQVHSGSGWMAGGFVSGILLGLIGTGVAWAMASSSTVEVSRVPEGLDASCYRDGYTSKAKSKNSTNALTGGLLGTAVLIVLVVSATSGSSY